jgi:hypothetical protein
LADRPLQRNVLGEGKCFLTPGMSIRTSASVVPVTSSKAGR